MGPNAVITNITQQKSKMSELAHAESGKIDTVINAVRQRVHRTIGAMQTSVSPDRRQNPWQQAQGGVVDQFGSLCGQWERLVGNDCVGECCCDKCRMFKKTLTCLQADCLRVK